MSEWAPISTAPKDGTEVWLYDCHDLSFDWGCWIAIEGGKGYWFLHGGSDAHGLDFEPTDWMPLPDPPKQ